MRFVDVQGVGCPKSSERPMLTGFKHVFPGSGVVHCLLSTKAFTGIVFSAGFRYAPISQGSESQEAFVQNDEAMNGDEPVVESDALLSGVEDIEDDQPYEAVGERKVLIQQYDYAVRTLMDMIIEGDLQLDPDYQRNYRWEDKKASRFIESIALNIPVPVFYFAEEPDGRFSVIDGQQRLTSLFRYIRPNDLDVLFEGKAVEPLVLEGLQIRSDLNGKSYNSLSREDRSTITKRPVRCIVVLNESDSTLKFEVFERLNTGSAKLTDQEVRNCIYRGGLNTLIKELSSNIKFNEMLNLPIASQKNMKSAELVLRFIAYKDLNDETRYNDNYNEYLNQFMEENREIGPQRLGQIKNCFESTVDILHSALGPGVAFRKPSNLQNPNNGGFAQNLINGSIFESQMVSVGRLVDSGVSVPDDIRDRILAAFAIRDYSDSIYQGTAQKRKAIKRSRVLTELLTN